VLRLWMRELHLCRLALPFVVNDVATLRFPALPILDSFVFGSRWQRQTIR
jgi:hypothetical protein